MMTFDHKLLPPSVGCPRCAPSSPRAATLPREAWAPARWAKGSTCCRPWRLHLAVGSNDETNSGNNQWLLIGITMVTKITVEYYKTNSWLIISGNNY